MKKICSENIKNSSRLLIIVSGILLFLLVIFISYSIFGDGKGTYSDTVNYSCNNGTDPIISGDKAYCCDAGWHINKSGNIIIDGTCIKDDWTYDYVNGCHQESATFQTVSACNAYVDNYEVGTNKVKKIDNNCSTSPYSVTIYYEGSVCHVSSVPATVSTGDATCNRVKIDGNGGTTVLATSSYKYADVYPSSSDKDNYISKTDVIGTFNFKKDGVEATNFATSKANCDSKNYISWSTAGTYEFNGCPSTLLYACWNDSSSGGDVDNSRVVLKGNGGHWDGASSKELSMQYNGTSYYVVFPSVPTYAYHTFTGYVDNPNDCGLGDATIYPGTANSKSSDTQKWPSYSNRTLYACWKEGEVKIKIYGINGDSSNYVEKTCQKQQGSGIYIYSFSDISVGTNGGKNFIGWSTNSCNTISLGPSAPNITCNNDRVFACWEGSGSSASSCSISFSSGVSSSVDVANMPASGDNLTCGQYTIPAKKPSRDGYTFTGWMDLILGTIYNAGDNVTLSAGEKTQLVAQWKRTSTSDDTTTCTYKIDKNSGSYANSYDGKAKEYSGKLYLNTSDGLKKYINPPSDKCFTGEWIVKDSSGKTLSGSPYNVYISSNEGDCGITLIPQFGSCSNNNNDDDNNNDNNDNNSNNNNNNDNNNNNNNNNDNTTDAEYSQKKNDDRCYKGQWVKVTACQPYTMTNAKCKISTGDIVDRDTILSSRSGCDELSNPYSKVIDDYRCNQVTGEWIYITSCQSSDIVGAQCKYTSGKILITDLTNGAYCSDPKPTSSTNTDKSQQDVSSSAQTGTIEVVIAWVIGVVALCVSFYYFRKNKVESK